MAGEGAPQVRTYRHRQAAVAAGSDTEQNVCAVEFAGVVSGVTYSPDTVLTGANTESRTLVLVNKGQAGAGTTVVATKAFVSTVNAAADDLTAITLSVTAADLVVAEGDVLAWQSTHVGATGLADPGGMVTVTISRTSGS